MLCRYNSFVGKNVVISACFHKKKGIFARRIGAFFSFVMRRAAFPLFKKYFPQINIRDIINVCDELKTGKDGLTLSCKYNSTRIIS